MKKQWIGSLLAATTAALGLAMPGAASAQGYPARPVRMIVTFAAGGGADYVARVMAPKLGEALGQPVVVDNRPGANGTVGADLVAKAAPDGYTLVLGAAGTLVVAPHLLAGMPFDPLKDLTPVSLVAISPFVVTLHPSVQANSVRELIALAKASPGKINYGTSGTGGSPQLATELFKSMTGVDMLHIPLKGAAPALTDVIAGNSQLIFATALSVQPYLQAGRLRPLAVTTAKRIDTLPDLPTIAESGVPGFEASTWHGMVVPTGTPRAVIARLNSEVNAILEQPDLRKLLVNQGAQIQGGTPERFAAYIKSEVPKWAKVIRDSGARVD